MTKKTPKFKKAPAEIYKGVFNSNYTPLELHPNLYPKFVKSIPSEKLHRVYISGSYEPAEPGAGLATISGETLIGGMDVYRHAPEDPKQYNKDWYAIFRDQTDERVLLFQGPFKDNEHWLDELPERLKNAEIYYVPAKTDEDL